MQTFTGEDPCALDAITVLQRARQRLEALCCELDHVSHSGTRREIVRDMGRELEVWIKLEERPFHRTLQRDLPDLREHIQRARRELGDLRRAFDHLRSIEPSASQFAICAQTFRQTIRQHARRNGIDLFPAARSSRIDLLALGAAMRARERDVRSSFMPQPYPGLCGGEGATASEGTTPMRGAASRSGLAQTHGA